MSSSDGSRKIIDDIEELRIEILERLDNHDMSDQLLEEQEARKQLQVESTRLVTEIKSSYESKLLQLRDEIRAKDDLNTHKQTLLNELDPLVKQLRNEIKKLNEELKDARSKEFDAEKRLSKKYRGSISSIESQLNKTSSMLESRIKEIEDKHTDEMNRKIQEYTQTIDQLKLSLNETNDELKEVNDRLEESRQAREEALGDLKSSRKKYMASIQELERSIEQREEQLRILQNDKSVDVSFTSRIDELESQLQEMVRVNQDMEDRLEVTKYEVSNKQTKIDESDRIIDVLQRSVNELEIQKKELQVTSQDYIRMSQPFQNSDNSAQKLLQDQLEKSQSACDAVKENLMVERLRTKELEENLANQKKNLELAKIDSRFYTRENRLLQEKIQKHSDEISKVTNELEKYRETNGDLEQKLVELEKTLTALNLKSEEDAYDMKQTHKMYEEIKIEKQNLEVSVKELKLETIELQEQLRQHENLKMELCNRDAIINEKDQMLQEKGRKIETLQMNLVVLREASTVLDKQLQNFETLVTSKITELENSESAKAQLEEECSLLKEQLKRSRIEINEAKSLKTFVEKRLNEVEGDLKEHDVRSSEKVTNLITKLDEMKVTNDELASTVRTLTVESEKLNIEKSQLESLVEKVKHDNIKVTEEVARAYNSLIDVKDQNITLKRGLEDAVKKGESYKSLVEIITKDHEAMDIDRYQREVQLQSTVQQQLKLIEHLQTQNESLTKKKAGKFHLFGKSKDENEFTPTSAKHSTMPGLHRPTAPAATPVRLVNEHRAVQSLEEKAANLKQQLALLQDSKEVKTQKDLILPVPKKEECILLHHKPESSAEILTNYHEFKTKTMMKTEKCWKCMEPMYFPRDCCVCKNCTGVFHVHCAEFALKLCGLPMEAVIKFELSKCPDKYLLVADEENQFVERCVYVAGDYKWEPHRIRIQNGKFLMYGDNADLDAQPIKTFPLNGKTRVELRIHIGDVPFPCLKIQSPLLLKVVTPSEVGLRAWDDNKCMFLLTSDNDQKQFLTRAILKKSSYKELSTTIESDDVFLNANSEISTSGLRKAVVFRDIENQLDVNCSFFISSDLYVLGCEGGLYSRRVNSSHSNTKVKIEGVDTVYQIESIEPLNSVLMIEGEDRHLVMVHNGLLRVCAEAAECSKPKLTVDFVSDVTNCHLIQVQIGKKGQVHVAAATPKHLLILLWEENQFVVKKRITTKDTVTCILMTPNSVIFGSDCVYELDIQNFQFEEFIDHSDESLYCIRFAYQMYRSFPVAILDVGMSNWNPKKGTCTPEFLLCYPDFGVFVDSFGRRTREEDIVWSKLPLAVVYRHPNLFIQHFSSVELIRLESDSYTRTSVMDSFDSIDKEYVVVPDSRFVYLTRPRLLGCGGKTASYIVSSVEKNKTEMFELDLEWITSQ